MKTSIIGSFIFTFLAADVNAGFDWGELVKAGGVTAICLYVLVRIEPQLKEVTRAIYMLAKTINVMLAELPHVIEAVKRQASDNIKECDQAGERLGDSK